MIFALVCALGAGPCVVLPPCDTESFASGGAPDLEPPSGRNWGDSFAPSGTPCGQLCESMKAVAEPKTLCWPANP